MSNETLTCICCGSNTVNTGEGWAHCQACYCEWQPHMHQADRIERAAARGGEAEKLSELMRGLEIPPAYAAFDARAFFVLGQRIAAQAKEAPGARAQEPRR